MLVHLYQMNFQNIYKLINSRIIKTSLRWVFLMFCFFIVQYTQATPHLQEPEPDLNESEYFYFSNHFSIPFHFPLSSPFESESKNNNPEEKNSKDEDQLDDSFHCSLSSFETEFYTCACIKSTCLNFLSSLNRRTLIPLFVLQQAWRSFLIVD